MSWRPASTKGIGLKEPHKVLLYGHHGWGKTWQVRNMQERFGKGILLSGEAGLKSLADVDVAFIPFTSWDGKHEPSEGVFSFRGIVSWIRSPDFLAEGYKWIALDSLTELSDLIYAWAQAETKESKNRFEVWDLYSTKMLATLKWFRDLNMHVYATCLASENLDDVSGTDYWPMVKSGRVARAIPAIFDHVFCGIRRDDTEGESVITRRFIVTEQMHGWHGKARDPYHRLSPVEECGDVTDLLERISRTPEEHDLIEKAIKKTAEAIQAAQNNMNEPTEEATEGEEK